jgi:hypothetical protein
MVGLTSSEASMRERMGLEMAQWLIAPKSSWEKSVDSSVKMRSGCACKTTNKGPTSRMYQL